MTPQTALAQTYASQYDAIARTMKGYLDGVREGKSELMRPAFHPAATFFGHYPGGVMNGQLQQLFDWVDKNGPAPDMQSRFASVQILGKIAYVHLELEGLSGALAGTGVSMSDIFTLMQTQDGWTIVQKAFHWHM
jgi:putative lumazine-binding protein